ncbi:hypothetical protein J7T55_005337 [Diaporthe amygdali]|uniref:uncharacterized protein n=1 Tax=Phomopsis amygdali TaxID=1214568 RepID=UPI0022FF35EE|nr:uncharacterized protein J7T55_005337 [Diaporthe amygdali]KAJ0108360.1 hypothetical protein J7T55_005337 [Diaporthe amygdali]
MTSKDPTKNKRVTFAGMVQDTVASEDEEEAETKAAEGPEATTKDLQTTAEPASPSSAPSRPAISKLASRKAQLTGLMTAGGKARQMKKWEKEYKAVEKELDEARGHVTPIFTASDLRKADSRAT